MVSNSFGGVKRTSTCSLGGRTGTAGQASILLVSGPLVYSLPIKGVVSEGVKKYNNTAARKFHGSSRRDADIVEVTQMHDT